MTAPVDFDNVWTSYRHHLCQILNGLGPWILIVHLAVVALGGWMGYAAYQHNSLATAAVVGALNLGVSVSVVLILWLAALDTMAARPWHGRARTVHHHTLGACTVLLHSDHPALATNWLLIRPRSGEEAAIWVPIDQVTRPTEDQISLP